MELPGVVTMKDFEISLDTVQRDILKLLAMVKPEWAGNDIQINELHGGISNKIFKCGNANDEDGIETIVIRIFGPLVSDFSSQTQAASYAIMHTAGMGTPLYAVFKNGIAYGYMHGQCLDETTVRDPKMARLIAKEMAKLHCLVPQNILQSTVLSDIHTKKEPQAMKYIMGILQALPEDFHGLIQNNDIYKKLPNKEALVKEHELIESVLKNENSPMVFCHNDLNPWNIIYNKDKDAVLFIDYDITGFNYQALDIGIHFGHFCGLLRFDGSLYPEKNFQKSWLRTYLEALVKNQGRKTADISDQDVERLYVTVNKFALYFYLAMGITYLSVTTNDQNNRRSHGLVSSHFGQYYTLKDAIMMLKLSE